ncbi:type III secretion system inner membrane ring lipoprotein SctJ [Mixta calida]|uniref:type III secretion system inner membrane ring lipoprotein SctJ n=1 Tax=Mixta calida TaxID=665913 RepID=UPI0028995D7E|nr:type III secretion inner membrane ring lipoprotein SctJ [Mixta calida]MDU5768931.1 type III secretion inner membrane ring lipoprotein SctJ [Mixta calida]MDU5826172.1 type III secretion inner membrane ring lipoprotein SctJ [Mixta calida]MDU6413940.1 type III secretion inner membrane ring lipoprotein SctJ [Mixta calida]
MRPSLVKALLIGALALLLSGCGDDTVLNSNLAENDANDIIAELNRYHIAASKQVDKTGVSVRVASENIERSVNILDAAGLPRKVRTNLGEVFQKSGVISSPMEERARYIYALSQEVESTLAQIDGVVVARVHVVLPERIAPGEPVQPASASVFIKYHDTLDPDSIEPRIRRLVATSIPGLVGRDDRDLAIVFVPAKMYEDRVETVKMGPFTLSPGQYSLTKGVLSVAGVLLLLILGIVTLRAGKKSARHTVANPGKSS